MNEESNIINHQDESGTYLSDILLDQKIITKVKNNGNLDINETKGINDNWIKRLQRKNVIYYGLMQGEQPVKIEQANNQFQVPLVQVNDINKRISKIKDEDKKKIGYIHINTIQLILRSTFREGISTPIELIVEDNRIVDNQTKILGIINGDLGYGVIKFNITLQYPIPITTRKINNCIAVSCNFKEKTLMEKGDIPFVVCYRIAYALSNSSLSLNYKNQERLYTDKLFNETSTVIQPDTLGIEFLRNQNQKIERPILLGSSSRNLVPRIDQPITRGNIFQTSQEDLEKQVQTLSSQIQDLSRKI